MDPIYLLVVAVVLIMGWFAFGVIYNLRHGDAMLKWMQVGLPKIGEKTTFRWMGSSVAEMVIAKAKPPFRRLETLLVLAPRDVPWLWLWAMSQGRRDTLIFRAQLANAPKIDLELADPASWTGRLALKQAAERGWESRPAGELTLMAPRGYLDTAGSIVEQLKEPTATLATQYRRFSLRREQPHLELHLAFPDTRGSDSASFFSALQTLASAISNTH